MVIFVCAHINVIAGSFNHSVPWKQSSWDTRGWCLWWLRERGLGERGWKEGAADLKHTASNQKQQRGISFGLITWKLCHVCDDRLQSMTTNPCSEIIYTVVYTMYSWCGLSGWVIIGQVARKRRHHITEGMFLLSSGKTTILEFWKSLL